MAPSTRPGLGLAPSRPRTRAGWGLLALRGRASAPVTRPHDHRGGPCVPDPESGQAARP